MNKIPVSRYIPPVQIYTTVVSALVCRQWSFLETEILRKIGEMVKKLEKNFFLILASEATRNTLMLAEY